MFAASSPVQVEFGLATMAPGGRLRPARPEEGMGLVWEPDLSFMQAPPFAFPQPGPFATWPPALPGMPAPPPFDASAFDAFLDGPGWRMPDAFDPAPEASPSWPPPDWLGIGGPPLADTDPVILPPPENDPGPSPLPPRPPALPEPLFPAPVLAGGVVFELAVDEGAEGIVHQPGVTDRAAEGLGWRITGGADAEKLLMDPASGALRFLAAPDFEAPGDADGDNRYELVFEVRDGWGAAASQQLIIAVTDLVWA